MWLIIGVVLLVVIIIVVVSTYGQGTQPLTTATVTEGGSNEESNTLQETPASADSGGKDNLPNPDTQDADKGSVPNSKPAFNSDEKFDDTLLCQQCSGLHRSFVKTQFLSLIYNLSYPTTIHRHH
jgi:hypothetical protein